ncbi:hypothetical protein SAMD00019534_096170 [Acytostelium subglobosum LB1]|uniref:hypothetical protein n=1 Tax=Acytostelium subglobosum LB1 TaxID=1410327 RepID=UPI0006451319|nr:hypothetical protein SAMD00019534_096170 [Acytostelium subglobosum LB1]GAM26442.1 hypothetical protein SAMD00019534_096170 [Acytostelium subglobosum LB1]|eukprot:XP_012750538.1 hypothetical protein SAMD00019534_096170 [Acytostelium subglobosum LB1]
MEQGPAIIDIGRFLENPESAEAIQDCKDLVKTLQETSCLVIKSPRVNDEENSRFLDMMEQYYEQPTEMLMKDVHPEWSYQLGATPEFTEHPRDHADVIKSLKPQYAAHAPRGADPKWRFFWRIGDRPEQTAYPELNCPPVIPEKFPHWQGVMDKWGSLMLSSIETVSEMIAVGYGLPRNTITELMKNGPHLLAPTGSDLKRFGELDQIFAGFHYDFNLLTIHGRSRFPGLYIWLRDGTRVLVRVPPGCLLLQAGKQLEWITGGDIHAGFHEVVVTKETIAAVQKAKDEGRSLWRISSTLFGHVASDKMLSVLPPFQNDQTTTKYPTILAGKQSEEELQMINLQQKSN